MEEQSVFSTAVRAVAAKQEILIVAGEPSSDHHAAQVAAALKRRAPDLHCFGMGGSALRAAGVETIVDSETHASVMGLTEVLGKLPEIYGAFTELLQAVTQRKPLLAILVDYPDFNLRLAKKLKALGVPVLYYVSPQLWAWRSGRVHKMKRFVRKVAVIFPFEEDFYHRHGVDAEYVGHPFLNEFPLVVDRDGWCLRHGLDPQRPILALLPGSRRAEIGRLLEPMIGAARLVATAHPGFNVVVPVAPGLELDQLQAMAKSSGVAVRFIAGEARQLLACATVAVVASGTATVEAALSGVPSVVVYRLSALTFKLARILVRGVKQVAMANLIAGEQVFPELLQQDVTPAKIAREIERYLGDPGRLKQVREQLNLVRKRLENGVLEPGPERTAKIALELLSEGRRNNSASKR